MISHPPTNPLSNGRPRSHIIIAPTPKTAAIK